MSQSRTWRRDWPLEAALTILAIVTYVPFVFTIISSFKSNPQFFTEFWLPTTPLHTENYVAAWRTIGRAIFNSFSYSIPTMVLTLVIAALAGYAFARYRFPGRQVLFFSILALIMIPGILLVIPMFSLIVDLNWNDTLQGVVLPWTALEVIIGIFLMRTFFETMPQELFEAARLDGADELTLLLRIAVPLAIPAFSTLAIVNLLFTWNDLLWPLIAISTAENHPVAIAVLGYAGPWQTEYGITFAGYVLASLPLIIIWLHLQAFHGRPGRWPEHLSIQAHNDAGATLCTGRESASSKHPAGATYLVARAPHADLTGDLTSRPYQVAHTQQYGVMM